MVLNFPISSKKWVFHRYHSWREVQCTFDRAEEFNQFYLKSTWCPWNENHFLYSLSSSGFQTSRSFSHQIFSLNFTDVYCGFADVINSPFLPFLSIQFTTDFTYSWNILSKAKQRTNSILNVCNLGQPTNNRSNGRLFLAMKATKKDTIPMFFWTHVIINVFHDFAFPRQFHGC